jgi:hypothetical protein
VAVELVEDDVDTISKIPDDVEEPNEVEELEDVEELLLLPQSPKPD